jgi:NAD(P)-dependent dehydrogenase (short-subunit alcohol dehydrogenase family)
MNLQGKVALITGGTHGIGAATALDFAARGADVALAARNDDDQARQIVSQVEKLGRRCALILADVSRPEEAGRVVAETAARLGAPGILVHSAGGPVPGGLLEIAPEDWHAAFDVHVHAIFYLCRAAVPAMRQEKEGAIVLISSTAGIRGVSFAPAYQVVKGALPQFARAMAREFADDNIRVNVVAPGVIRTRFHASMTPETRKHNLDNRIPLHCEGTPQQVAQVITGLVSNDYITGETMVIDGGLTMRIA